MGPSKGIRLILVYKLRYGSWDALIKFEQYKVDGQEAKLRAKLREKGDTMTKEFFQAV